MLKKICKAFAIIIQFAEQKYSVKHVLKEGNPENLNQLMFSILRVGSVVEIKLYSLPDVLNIYFLITKIENISYSTKDHKPQNLKYYLLKCFRDQTTSQGSA